MIRDDIYKPLSPNQELFFSHSARSVGYAGAPGTGKTLAMLYWHASYLLDIETQRWKRGEIPYSDAWCIFFRRTFPNLRQPMQIAHHTFPHLDDPPPKWSQEQKTWTYACGLTFQFAAMEHKLDYRNFLGPSYIGVSMDELPEFEEEQQGWLDTRIRTKHEVLKPFLNFRWGANPEGQGLGWMRRRFFSAYKNRDIPYGTTIRRKIRLPDNTMVERDEVVIQALPKDNPLIYGDGQYEATIRSAKPHMAEALLSGDFFFTPDGLFSPFWRPHEHICENHLPPRRTWRFRSCDFGIWSPSSVTWWYVDEDGCMTAYYQLWMKGLTADKQAARIKEVEKFFGDWDEDNGRSLLRRSPIDSTCFNRGGSSGPTIAKEFYANGVPWIPSVKDRYNGIAEFARRLQRFVEVERGGVKIRKPAIRWMKRCARSIDYIPNCPSDPDVHGEVAPNYPGRHVVDDHIFACMSNPLRANLRVMDGGLDYDEDEPIRRKFPRRIAEIA